MRKNTVGDWVKHVEIVIGFKDGYTSIGTPQWTQNIYDKFCSGETAFGASGVNFVHAIFQVIKTYNPEKYELALSGLLKTIEQEQLQGKAMKKMSKLYEELYNNR